MACALIALLASSTSGGDARAAEPAVDVRTWRPSTDPNASVVIEPATTPGPGVFSFGAYSHYALHPVTLRDPSSGDVRYRPVSSVLGIDPVLNLGIGQRFAIGATLPVIAWQTGSRALPPSVSDVDKVPGSALGDLGLTLKGNLIRNDGGGFGLAALGYVSLPTGNRSSFAGEGAPTVSARLLAEYTLLVAAAQVSLGYKLRTEDQRWPDAGSGGYTFGGELPWSIGLALRPGFLGVDPGNRQRWEIGAHGWLPVGPVGPFGAGDPGSAALSPALLAISDRIELGHYRDAYVLAGAEVGLTQAVGVPITRFVLSIGWAPREHDLDRDGVKDDVDGCPEIPEDKDGFEDSDGCPEVDNDDDGILDREDACPDVAGEASSDPKKNGCPLPDDDGDGVPDESDACPRVKGARSDDPARSGCPGKDSDGDGIDDAVDKCPSQAEDKDGFEDQDGCPDPDNDGDGIGDREDACPDAKGEPSGDPMRHGCPELDRDGDTFDNDKDKCPNEAEVWNGVDDDDGCPDQGGKALAVIDAKKTVRLATPITFTGPVEMPEVAPASIATVRALAAELNRHPTWTLAVGAKPQAGLEENRAQMEALARSFAVVRELSAYSHRDGVVETVGWEAVKKQPQEGGALGFLILTLPTPDEKP